MQMARLVTTSAETVEERFEALFHQHYCGIVSLLYPLLGTTEEAEELVRHLGG